MKTILLCNVPFKQNVEKTIYSSEDSSIPVSGTPVKYPINSYFEATLGSEDELDIILLVKKDQNENYKKNTKECIEEFKTMGEKTGAKVNFKTIISPFVENRKTHEALLLDIINELEEGSHISVDMTYGPKDLAIVLFTALNFAEKFYGCEIDSIMYGQAEFIDNKAVNAKLCEMAPLYYLNSITNTLSCETSESATKALKTLLSM